MIEFPTFFIDGKFTIHPPIRRVENPFFPKGFYTFMAIHPTEIEL